ncbi:MAG: gliding motility lipoprotein GldD [bacterium]
MKNNNYIIHFFTLIIIAIFFSACSNNEYVPKPRGYYRINLPEKSYVDYSSGCNYSFKIPVYADVRNDSSRDSQPCWKNVVYPTLNGRLHLSYFKIENQKMLGSLIEDSRRLVFKHTVKAEGIQESKISNDQSKVYGLFYDIEGNAASSIQFFVTDSSSNFLRGALYFYAEPQADSIAPVLEFVKKDIMVMLESFNWK